MVCEQHDYNLEIETKNKKICDSRCRICCLSKWRRYRGDHGHPFIAGINAQHLSTLTTPLQQRASGTLWNINRHTARGSLGTKTVVASVEALQLTVLRYHLLQWVLLGTNVTPQ